MTLILARSMELPFALLGMIFGFIFFMNLLQNRAKERKERLRVLEGAIRSGNLDAQTQQDLMEGLAGGRRRRHRPAATAPQPRGRYLYGLGWLGMFVGIGLMLVGDRDVFEAGIIVTAISFGVVTLPFAMREFEQRRGAPEIRS